MKDVNLEVFVVAYDQIQNKVVEQLTEEELKFVTAYTVQKKVKKLISPLVNKTIKEWELPWNNYDFQSKQYYEYGTFLHLYNNYELIKDLTHVGVVHYDVIFNKNSVNEIIESLKLEPETIFYEMRRGNNALFLSDYELDRICEFMSNGLGMNIDSKYIKNNEWISECLSVTPKHVFLKFAKFLNDFYLEIENILLQNRWGIMNTCNHRMCGIVERMWGFYLISCGLPLKQMNIRHDWNSYQHKHLEYIGTGLNRMQI
jgi:hypothetical protein